MKRAFSQAPLFRVLLPFLVGISIAILYVKPNQLYISGLVASFAGVILYAYYRFRVAKNYRLRWVGGFGISMLLFSLGVFCVALNKLNIRPDFFAKNIKPGDSLMVQITDPLQVKDKSIRAIARVTGVGSVNSVKPASGKLVLYFQIDSGLKYPSYGDVLFITAGINEIKPPDNPGEFDYSHYMASQNIYHTSYLKPNDWTICAQNNGNQFWKVIYDIRNRLKTDIEDALPGRDEKGIAEALVFGEK